MITQYITHVRFINMNVWPLQRMLGIVCPSKHTNSCLYCRLKIQLRESFHGMTNTHATNNCKNNGTHDYAYEAVYICETKVCHVHLHAPSGSAPVEGFSKHRQRQPWDQHVSRHNEQESNSLLWGLLTLWVQFGTLHNTMNYAVLRVGQGTAQVQKCANQSPTTLSSTWVGVHRPMCGFCLQAKISTETWIGGLHSLGLWGCWPVRDHSS